MYCRLSLVLGTAIGFLTVGSFGCSPSTATVAGSGGSKAVSGGGESGTGGASETGGHVGTGGAAGTGGETGAGGVTMGSGGKTGSGGATSAGGATSRDGGATGMGGTATNDGAADGVGRSDGGGRPDAVGRTDSGPATMGGGPGSGGATNTGGTSGAGGSTGTPGTTKKFFGNIDTQGQIRSDFKTYWDQFSPENAGKWGSVQPSSGTFNWSSLDAMYKYCTDNNILFKQHNFTWGAQQPSWVTSSNAMTAVPAWISAFCTRYPKVALIDVVNEPLHNQAGYTGGIGGAGTSGYDWIVQMFKWARASCPGAILIVNDYNTIEYSSENGRIQTLVNAVLKAGGPIDAVGNQGHDVGKVSASTVLTYTNNIITGTGLPVYITEMDVGEADDNTQL